MKKVLTGKRHLVWNSKGEIVFEYYQEDGEAKTYYNDGTSEKFEGFASNLKAEIDAKKEEKKLKPKPEPGIIDVKAVK